MQTTNNMILRLFTFILLVHSKALDRLGHDCTPSNYDLYFDLQDEQFKGTVQIDFEANSTSKTIKLNSDGLEIRSVSLVHDSTSQEGRATIENEVLTLNFDEQVEKGKAYKLKVSFEGKYSKTMDGIYKSSYFGKTMISTHFEPTFARKAFPCFDQPDLKATFTIRVKADPSYPVVLSNSSKKEVQQDVHIFEKTVPMSTYLVAFVVGHLECKEIRSKNNIPIRVYADKKDIEASGYALQIAKEALDFFELYFKSNYQFPKLDLVPVPSFATGAMENWGLVTFRRSSLLYDPSEDTTLTKLRVAQTVCHELAHMWFGNSVTMAWWNDLWLNEGFATWASSMALYNISDKLIDLDIWLNFINEDLERGMSYDALHSSHPIAVTVKNPSEINQIFDSISYSKGASILRMIENYLGHRAFRNNIQTYLSQHKLKNSVSSELFESVSEPKITLDMLNTWIQQEGFPIIKVTESTNSITLEQTRFLIGKKNNGEKNWIIPITLTYTDSEPVMFLMKGKSMQLSLKSQNYKLNYLNTGVYRVLYENKTFVRLLQSSFISKEKLNVVNDMFSLAFGGYLDIRWVIDTIRDNLTDKDYEILKSIFKNTMKLIEIFYDDQKAVNFIKNFLNDIFSPLYESLNFTKQQNGMNENLRQALIISSGLVTKNATIKSNLDNLFNDFKEGKKETNPDFTQAMFNHAANTDFEWLLDFYRTKKNSPRRIMAIRALGSGVTKLDDLNRMFQIYKEIERQDFIYFVHGLAANYKFKKQSITFFIDNFEEIKEFINNESLLNSVFRKRLEQPGISEDDKITVEAIINGTQKWMDSNEKTATKLDYEEKLASFKESVDGILEKKVEKEAEVPKAEEEQKETGREEL